jgi:acyl carrier protein
VESVLLQSKIVKEAVVIDGSDDKGDKYLCAYVVSPQTLEPSHLRELLSRSLPDYMIPAYFVQVDRIPLTPNGKIHRKALPIPGLHTGVKYVAPKGELENRLAALWSEVLPVKQCEISTDADFFELGGHSLKATVLISRIHKELNVKITLGDVFEHPTIKELAQTINKSKQTGYTSIQPVEKKEYHSLSSAQQRLYIIYQMAPGSLTYNMPAVTTPQGDIDGEKLEKTFKNLVHRHESLRTSFRMANNRPVQQVHDQVEFEIEYHKVEVEERGQKTEDRRNKT